MSEITPEPNEKPSATLSRFDQNLSFFVMVLACAAVTFIKLDDLIGAAGIDGIASWYGLGCAALLAISVIVLVFLWEVMPFLFTLLSCLVFLLTVTLNIYIPVLLFAVPASFIALLSPVIFPLLGGLLLVLWFYHKLSLFLLKPLTILLLLFCVEYLLGNIVNQGLIENIARLGTGRHHFIAQIHWDIDHILLLSDPHDKLVLYTCNLYAVNCHLLYERNIERNRIKYGNPTSIINLRVENDILRLYVDDKLWFEHNPSEG